MPTPDERLPPRILVVDDDPFAGTVAAMALTQAGVGAVKTCTSGGEAAAMAKALSPDLVVLDLHLRDMDGRAAWREISSRLSPVPRLIFLTADDDKGLRSELRDLGACGVIAKPFDPSTLAREVAELLGFAHAPTREARYEALTAEFGRSLNVAIAAIVGAWSEIATSGWRRDHAETIYGRAHRLAGSAGLFHFDAVGRAADRVESLAHAALNSQTPPAAAALKNLETAIRELERSDRAGAG